MNPRTIKKIIYMLPAETGIRLVGVTVSYFERAQAGEALPPFTT